MPQISTLGKQTKILNPHIHALWEHVSAITDNVGPGGVAGGIRREVQECAFQFMDLALAPVQQLARWNRYMACLTPWGSCLSKSLWFREG